MWHKSLLVDYLMSMSQAQIMIHRMAQVRRIILKENRTIKEIFLGVRDYIHVVDLAVGHIAAMKKFKENCGLKVAF